MKDEAAGEIPVAFVVRSKGSEISEDEIKKYISQQVLLPNMWMKYLSELYFCGYNKNVFVAGGVLQENW